MKSVRLFSAIVICLIAAAVFCAGTAFAAYSMPYYIDVDLSNNIVTVYSSEDDSIVRQMICSSGTYIAPSPEGVYYMPENYKTTERTEWYKFEDGYGKYGTRIWYHYLFHSYLFDEPDDDTTRWDTYAALGTSASHGCIRLYIEDAKWIAENCFAGTKVNMFQTDKRYPYIKDILHGNSYTTDSGLTYSQYMSLAENEGEMGYSSKGDDVKALQEQLIQLGLYDGEANGFYSTQMVRTVKALQKLLGQKVTGVADAALISALNSDACPVSYIRTLSEGMTGEAVRALQSILASLGLYQQEISGIYDALTSVAVSSFQKSKGYIPDGIATPALQQEMIDEIESLTQKFGNGGFVLTYEELIHTIGTVNTNGRLNVRAEDGSIITGLESGTRVEVIDKGPERTLVAYANGKQGYVSTPHMIIGEEVLRVPVYKPATGSETALPALNLSKYAQTHSVSYGTLNIRNNLRVRSAADTESEMLFIITVGGACRILSIDENGWANIMYGNKTGYAQAKYFDICNTVELTGEFAAH